MSNYESDMLQLADLIPPAEMERVMSSDASAEIDPTCLTCLNYVPLAELIPQHWTVVDFGCSYNAQAYLFKDHKRLISVDLSREPYVENGFNLERFSPPWSELYEMEISEWLDKHLTEFDLAETFAICGYVPSPSQIQRVRESFTNLFVFYPSDKEFSRKMRQRL